MDSDVSGIPILCVNIHALVSVVCYIIMTSFCITLLKIVHISGLKILFLLLPEVLIETKACLIGCSIMGPLSYMDTII